jgi:hypothetical protein
MITDKTFILTGTASQNFTSTGGYTSDYVDLTASGRGTLGDGEDLYAVFHITAPPSGYVSNVQVELRASDTANGTNQLTGTIVALGTSRIYPIADLNYAATTINTVDTGDSTFKLTGGAVHGLQIGEAIYITSTANYPTITGFGTDFKVPLYVSATGFTASNFRVSLTPAGAAVAITGAGTGTVGFRRATAATGLAVSPAIEICINPEAVSRGRRYVQGFVTLVDGTANTQVPMTCVVTHCPTDNQRFRVYPTSIVAS